MDISSENEMRAAEEAGMSVEQYRHFQALKAANAIYMKKQKERQEAEAAAQREQEEIRENHYRAVGRQRNLLAVLCAALIVAVLCLAFGKQEAPKANVATNSRTQEMLDSSKAPYVASKNSGKYHKRKCDFVENIYPENRVYYETTAAAERAGKEPCAVCRP